MNSMTGYGRGVATGGGSTVTAEVSSVNKRTLEVRVVVPKGMDELEPMLDARVRGAITRGAVRIALEVSGCSGSQEGLSWDDSAVLAVLERLRQLCAKSGVPFQPTTHLLVDLARDLRASAPDVAIDTLKPLAEKAVDAALEEFAEMRRREGGSLSASLAGQLENLRVWVAGMRPALAGVLAYHRDQMLKRLREAGLDLDVSDERVLKEIALFVDRSDVTEELTRLESHFDQFDQFLRAREPIGRKVEFLLQEIHRELNTLGSKSPSVEVTRTVMDCKNELERMREQAANIE
jgi:uncharacterized protein (TIGR00255 family)